MIKPQIKSLSCLFLTLLNLIIIAFGLLGMLRFAYIYLNKDLFFNVIDDVAGSLEDASIPTNIQMNVPINKDIKSMKKSIDSSADSLQNSAS